MKIDIENELRLAGTCSSFAADDLPVFNTPITAKENFFRFMRRESPLWMPCAGDVVMFYPRVVPDNVACGFVTDKARPFVQREEAGGRGWFGVEWEFVAAVGGSIVRPGTELLAEGLENWRDVIHIPTDEELDALDWAGCARGSAAVLEDERHVINTTIFASFFERLISFMGFENAAMALIDEEQQGCVHQLFDALAEFYQRLIVRFQKYFHASMVCLHDDWGSQRAPLLSLATIEEMIAPHMRKVADFLHERGMFFMLHSCGKNELLVPAMIAAGADIWAGQPMNDKRAIIDKYGDRLYLAEFAGRCPPGSTEEDWAAAARSFAEGYGGYCRHLFGHQMSGSAVGNRGVYRGLYPYTRRLFAGEEV